MTTTLPYTFLLPFPLLLPHPDDLLDQCARSVFVVLKFTIAVSLTFVVISRSLFILVSCLSSSSVCFPLLNLELASRVTGPLGSLPLSVINRSLRQQFQRARAVRRRGNQQTISGRAHRRKRTITSRNLCKYVCPFVSAL